MHGGIVLPVDFSEEFWNMVAVFFCQVWARTYKNKLHLIRKLVNFLSRLTGNTESPLYNWPFPQHWAESGWAGITKLWKLVSPQESGWVKCQKTLLWPLTRQLVSVILIRQNQLPDWFCYFGKWGLAGAACMNVRGLLLLQNPEGEYYLKWKRMKHWQSGFDFLQKLIRREFFLALVCSWSLTGYN